MVWRSYKISNVDLPSFSPRAHVGSDTGDVLQDLASPSELGDNLLVRECGERAVSPGVDRKLVSEHVLGLNHLGARDGTRADDEEGGLDVLGGEEVEKARSVGGRSIVCRGSKG